MRKKTAGHNLLLIIVPWKITVQIAQGRMVRKETTVTINKVTVSFLSVERAGPALGERGLLFTVEMIIAFESVRMTTIRINVIIIIIIIINQLMINVIH